MLFVSRRRTKARGGVFAGPLVATSVVALLLLTREPDNALQHAQTSAFIAYALVFAAGVFAYFDWRFRTTHVGHDAQTRLSSWLTVGLVVTAVHGLVGALTAPESIEPASDRWPLVNQLALLLVLFVVAAVAEHMEVPTDPVLAGAVLALVLASGYVVTRTVAPPLVMSAQVTSLLNTVVMLAGLVLALIVLQRTHVSLWARRRLAGAAVILTAAQCLTNLAGEHSLAMVAIVTANAVGAIILCAVSQTLLRRSLFVYQQEMVSLHASLAAVRAGVQEDQELLHEVGSALAGIASASRMIHQGAVVEPVRRERLEAMVAAEVARLERLMSNRALAPAYHYEVDEVIEPLVVSHQARGRDVRWEPTGLTALGAPDDLAEVVNILLENAARHGGDGTVELAVRQDGEQIEVTCSDTGPGVAPELRDKLFTSGVRSATSRGQGYGLAIARRLMLDAGGTLDLADHSSRGATFVARFPRIEVARAAASNVA